jgi:hypothetical protein
VLIAGISSSKTGLDPNEGALAFLASTTVFDVSQ